MSVDPTVGAATAGPPLVGATPSADTSASPSLGSLLSEITKDVSTLMRQEVALAKAELSESAKNAGKGAGMLSGAAVAGHMVLLFLSIGLWWGLGSAIGRGWSALVVAVVWAIVAAVLASRGRAELKQVQGAPRTADTVKKIPNALAGHEEKN